MVDIFSPEQRSLVMSKISGKATKPEILVRRYLFAKGFRYRKNDNRYPGKPDIVLPKYKTVIFVHGCFWHGHSCQKQMPESNRLFWQEKISKNQIRDYENKLKLESVGFHVITVWECELKNKKSQQFRFKTLHEEILQNQT